MYSMRLSLLTILCTYIVLVSISFKLEVDGCLDIKTLSVATVTKLNNKLVLNRGIQLVHMEMEEDFRLRPSSAFIALSTLTPPSPVLSPTQLPTALTSGDIPILLDLGDQPARCSLHQHERASLLDLDGRAYPCSSHDTISASEPVNNPLFPYPSVPEPCSSTPGNRDTFGGLTGSPTGYSDASARESEIERSISNDHSGSTISAHLKSSSPPDVYSLGTTGPLPVSKTSKPVDDRKGKYAVCQEDEIPLLECSESAILSMPDSDNSYSTHSDLGHLSSRYLTHHPHLLARPDSSFSRSLKNLTMVVDDETGVDAFHLRHAAVESLPGFLRSPESSHTVHSFKPSTSPPGPQRSQSSLPTSLAWLGGSTIELSIDQEGFRAVQACFKFTGYSSQRSWDPYGNSLDSIAQFRPVSRQIFYFHYATLESLPVLRRITVNGDEVRDYTTRQASLGLKANGVYTVRGNEPPSLPATFSNGGTPVKLDWKFEYFVDDRRLDSTGKKIVDGEKTLTPLTFSCSPLLLHPFQGKRITMIHIFKKSVATKLVAEKMEPPSTLSSETRSPASVPRSQPIHIHLLNKPSVWNLHRRARSHGPPQAEEHGSERKPDSECPTTKVLQNVDAQTLHQDSYRKSIRRRRASSAGEWDRPNTDLVSPNANDTLHHRRPSTAYHPARRIIPLSRLAELLEQEIENVQPAAVSPSPPVDVSGFQPLRPSPRHYQVQVLTLCQ